MEEYKYLDVYYLLAVGKCHGQFWLQEPLLTSFCKLVATVTAPYIDITVLGDHGSVWSFFIRGYASPGVIRCQFHNLYQNEQQQQKNIN